jgi:F-type H+-transporting ATPase subunit gamma
MSQKLTEVKNRITSVDNIKTTAKTMATVAAAKFARTANKATRLEAYSRKIHEILSYQSDYISKSGDEIRERFPLLVEKPKTGKIVLFTLASDIGMCGSYNTQISKTANRFIDEQVEKETEVVLATKGLKAQEYFEKKTNYNIALKFDWSNEGVSIKEAGKLLNMILAFYEKTDIQSVHVAYTKFYSATKMVPQVIRLLPISQDYFSTQETREFSNWIYEPGPTEILDELIPLFLRIKVYDILLEAYASEQSSRMMAMEQATDRAEDALKELRVKLNKMRRDIVTLDLLGILSAAGIVEKESAARTGF